MKLLTPQGKQRIQKAVQEAEKRTGGEIVPAIIPESDDYAASELMFGIACGIIAYVLLVFWAESFAHLLDSLLWVDSPVFIPLAMMAVTLLVGTLAYALAQIPALDRIIIGKHRMREAVRCRAMRCFMENAVYNTMDRTGVLLFISVLERRVELIADMGIHAKVKPEIWENIVNDLVLGIKAKQADSAIEKAIIRIGEVLAEFVPPRPNDVNELSDGPVELERGS